MGDKKGLFRVQFNHRIKLEFHGVKVTSDAGLLLYRELDNVLGLTAIESENVVFWQKNVLERHGLRPQSSGEIKASIKGGRHHHWNARALKCGFKLKGAKCTRKL